MSVELVVVAQSQFEIELISQALVYTEGGNATGEMYCDQSIMYMKYRIYYGSVHML